MLWLYLIIAFVLVAGVLAGARPLWFAGYVFLVLVFAKTLDHLSGGLLAYLDEVTVATGLVVLVARRAWSRRMPRWFPGLGWFMAFGALGLVSGIVAGVDAAPLITASFLALKGVVVGFTLAQIDWTPAAVRAASRVAVVVIMAVVATSILNAVNPSAWTAVFTRTGTPDIVAGLPSLVGPFTHPGDLGLMLALAAVAVFAYRRVIGRGWVSLVLLLASVAGSLASLRRKSLVGMAAGFLWLATSTERLTRRMWIVIAVIALAGVGVVLSGGLVQSTINDYVIHGSSHPRVLLTLGAATVATDHFPWGAGFGRYGSFVAASNYSPEYVQLGFDRITETAPGSTYLTDTQWPAIVGEAGWIGGAAFAIGLVRMWLPLRRAWASPSADRWERLAALVGMGWMIQLLIESIAAPVYVTSPSAGVGFAVVAVVVVLTSRRSETATAERGQVDRLIAYQWDPRRPSLGGVDTCLRGLANYSPTSDAESIAFVGVDARGSFELGVWAPTTTAGGRSIWFLSVARLDPDGRRRLIPHGLRLAYGLVRYRAQLPSAPIVQGHKLESTAMLHWLFPRARVVSFIHSQAGALAAPGSDSKWRGLGDAQVRGERALTRKAASVVVFNPSYAEELSTINPHVHAAATWFDPAVVRPGVHDAFALVWVGRLEPPKDPLLALAVFRVLAEGHPSEGWHLTMIGEGSLRAQIIAMIASWPPGIRDRVRFMGALSPEDAAREVGDSGVLLMTSVPDYEGFPRVLVEGLASGLPAVVTRGTDTGNLVREGLTGRTCGRDPSELAAAVREVRALDRDAIRATVSGLDGSRMVPELFALTRADAGLGL